MILLSDDVDSLHCTSLSKASDPFKVRPYRYELGTILQSQDVMLNRQQSCRCARRAARELSLTLRASVTAAILWLCALSYQLSCARSHLHWTRTVKPCGVTVTPLSVSHGSGIDSKNSPRCLTTSAPSPRSLPRLLAAASASSRSLPGVL